MQAPKLNLLIAYPYFNDKAIAGLRELGDDVRFLLDSGAFTAFKSGKAIHLDDYCRFIETLPVTPWRYFTLDVIGDAAATHRNYDLMRMRGFSPVPIFTRGAPLSDLDAYFETSDLVGLGGVAGRDPGAYAWVKLVMQHVGTRKAHILGFSAIEWLKYLRPYSVDSTTWINGGKYGAIAVYLGGGQLKRLRVETVRGGVPPAFAQAIRATGFDPSLLQERLHWTHRKGSIACWLGAASYMRFGSSMEQRIGTRYFLAVAPGELGGIIAAFRAATGVAPWPMESFHAPA